MKNEKSEHKLYDLSHPQKRIWYSEKTYPGVGAANLVFLVKFDFKADNTILESAINAVINAHQGIRMRITELTEQETVKPCQYIEPHSDKLFDVYDFHVPGGTAKLKNWSVDQTSQPFEFLDSDLFYFALLRHDDGKSGYYMKLHHIVSDGGTVLLFLRDIKNTYFRFLEGKAADFSMTNSYIDFLNYEQKYLNSARYNEDKLYWEEEMLPLPEEINLSGSRSTDGSMAADKKILAFDNGLRDGMRKWAKENKTSVFKLVYTAVSIYTSRITGIDDFVLPTFNHNRSIKKQYEMAGMFISTIPVRIRMKGDDIFGSLVKTVGDQMNYLIKERQKYPFDELAVNLRDKSGIDPSFFMNVSVIGHQDVLFEDMGFEHIQPPYEAGGLSIHVNPQNKDLLGILELEFDYKNALYSEASIETIFKGICNIISAGIKHPEQKIKDLPIIDKAQINQVIHEFNATEEAYNLETTLVHMFDKQVESYGDSPALVLGDEKLTYNELASKADSLAFKLHEAGVGPETIVGLIAGRRVESIIAMLAILKAGGVYLPIDPKYPEDRILYILKDSGAKLLLAHCDEVPSSYTDNYFDLSDSSLFTAKAEKLPIRTDSKNAAYIIYTSGSTGRPKGVVIEHRSVVNLVNWHSRAYGITAGVKTAEYASFSFDASVSQIFSPLLNGAELHLISEDIRLNPVKINEYLEENQIIYIDLPTPMCEQFLEMCDNNSLKVMTTGGEKLKKYSLPKFRLVDEYGPTENTVISTHIHLDKKWIKSPIGKPVPNTRAYILDRYKNPQPLGVAGELYLAGAGLARGYLNRPELTLEKFVADPFFPGQKMYRTGDLAKWLPDGNIDFLGRIDFQVKIRGYRIELEEIEARIVKLPHVTNAVVDVREDNTGSPFLCAWVETSQENGVSDIQASLKADMPDYMVPAFITAIDTLPMNSSGKVDRRALPEPDLESQRQTEYEPPKTETEKKLALIWEKILGLKKISANDSFLSLGGHSLKALTMQYRIQKVFKINLPISEIFKLQTLRRTAAFIEQLKDSKEDEIKSVPVRSFYPVTSAQKRLYLIHQMGNVDTAYNIPLVMRIQGPLDHVKLGAAIDELVLRHEILRTGFKLENGIPVLKVHQEVTPKRVFAETSPNHVQAQIKDFVKPFDLENAPLFRTALFRESANSHVFVFDVHHIIMDGLSVSILMKELWDIYGGNELPALEFSYKDFSVWQQETNVGGRLPKQQAYWLDVFKGFSQTMEFEADHVRKASMDYSGGRLLFDVPETVKNRLAKVAEKSGVTLFTTMLAAYGIFLMRHTSCTDLVVGIPSSGRTIPEVENMLGMFVGTMPLRLFPDKNTPIKNYLSSVNQTVMGALDNQDYPLEDLVEQLGVKREPGRTPLLDVLFTLREMPSTMKAGELSISPVDYDPGVSKFDQTFEAIIHEEGIQLKIEYKKALFDEETVLGWGDQYIQLLEQICEHPDKTVGEYDIILPRERKFLLEKFNDTSVPCPNQTVTDCFCQQAKRTPDAVAIKQEDRTISFSELDSLTNRLANRLRAEGVSSGQVVGVVGSASIEFIVGILGILKAGGAYVPVDIGYPAERINFMMKEADVRLVLTTSGNDQAQKLAPSLTCLKLEDEQTYSDNDLMPDSGSNPSDPIYIIYTSGSTGKPKGVMVTHKGVLNYLLWVKSCLLQDQVFDVPLYSSLSFDLVVTSVFLPLLTGSRMVIYPGEDKSGLVEKIIRENEVDVLKMTPSHLALLEMVDCQSTRVKKLIVGGENLSTDLCRRVLAKFPQGLSIVNEYGPTEASVACSWHAFNPATDRGGAVPIGIPADNARLYILDEDLRLVPRGAVGELYIAGDGLADCYVNRQDLTDLAFLPDPFISGERMYKTGDLVRMSVQGRIVYLGRKDHQVKIRGYRIETSEIENVLGRYPSVKDTYVLAVAGDNLEDSFLCGYYTGPQEIAPAELKDFLLQELPGYMVPSHLIYLDNIPVTANGKVDRRALPMPGNNTSDKKQIVKPQTEVEKKVLDGFCSILKKNNISMTDNFFDMGGNSLKAVTLIYELKKHVEIGVNDIFKYQTPERLARNVRPLENNLMKKLLEVKERFGTGPDSEIENSFAQMESSYKDQYTPYETLDLSDQQQYESVLLTGVTGFLGIFLLNGLLTTGTSRIHLIIRSKDSDAARARLDSKWEYYFKCAMPKIYKERIQIHAGDLSSEKIGLNKADWEKLAQEVDCIINAAALVKHYGHYEEFVTANVVSASNLIEFALHGRDKVLHQISTTSVGLGNIDDKKTFLFTEFDTDAGQKTDNFYLTTKLEAEKQIISARQQGLTANIYRVSNIVFDSINGRFQENIEDNGFFRQVKSYVAIGAVPEGMDRSDFSFVDQVAGAILTLFDRPALFNEIFHIQHETKQSVAELLEDPALNLPTQRMRIPQFIDFLMEKLNFDEYREDIESLLLHLGWLEKKTAQTTTMISSDKTILVLKKLGFEWPSLNPETARKFVLEALKKRMEFLKSIRAFTGLPAQAIEGLALKSRHEVFAENSLIQMEGDAATNIFLIVKGFVEISKLSHSGWAGTIKIAHAGDFVAMQNFAEDKGASITIEAIMGEAQVVIINREALLAQVVQTPELAVKIMQVMAGQHRDLEKLLVYSS
ncbi:amino acid adenylation domain-containing protein/thioester reductase domain-containing protein [Maridesulfovibrio ferrireducens]|uniref:Amino acid adenylation domain-containing protein/thioester reductase domain-containing protein n=1 Tax=Maridesulfovibrio ferrireducens TaxID=246191 RepID=A0A1G9KV00_9BACT|nr:non-ribosomal peptide synthetase [Maridesulfovibrio ferrireducens]SDL53333.1 amino acid adenylation domain-containing protein/thioester reductase domain-containing protein [Maridesulfovibrio ferrireducens]